MKVLIRIGYQTLLLPNDSGVQALLRVLAKALPVDDCTYAKQPHVDVRNEPLQLEMRIVPDNVKVLYPEEVVGKDAAPPRTRQVRKMLTNQVKLLGFNS